MSDMEQRISLSQVREVMAATFDVPPSGVFVEYLAPNNAYDVYVGLSQERPGYVAHFAVNAEIGKDELDLLAPILLEDVRRASD